MLGPPVGMLGMVRIPVGMLGPVVRPPVRIYNQPFLIYCVYTFISSKLFFFVLFSGNE